jgi:magnesium transporter
MITLYRLQEKKIVGIQATCGESLPCDALWIDLLNPTPEEKSLVSKAYNQLLPSAEDVQEIEASSRFFIDEQGLHIRSYFLFQFPERFENVTMAFILNQGRLFTIRHEKLESIHIFKQRLATGAIQIKDNFDLLFSLFEIKVDRLADRLELLQSEIDNISQDVYDGDNRNLEHIVLRLGSLQDTNDKIRLGMLDMQRLFSFFKRSGYNLRQNLKILHSLIEDIDSLVQYSTFLFDKSDSLLNVTIGLISSEQNKIIRIFSIISVVFMPPTLVASLYGMNFDLMPELHWPHGYLFALALMLVSAIVPYLLFRLKGWL